MAPIRAYFDPLLLGLPTRVLTALAKNDVTRIEEVAARNSMELNALDGIGPASVKSIRQHLQTFNLSLETQLDDVPLYYGKQKRMLSWLTGFFSRRKRWWQIEKIETYEAFSARRGWITGKSLECIMENGSRTVSVLVDREKEKIDCSCGSSRCREHGLAAFLLMVEAERRNELFGASPIEDLESAPAYQPLSHDPLYFRLDSTVRKRLLDESIYWTEELATYSPSDMKEEIRRVGEKRAENLTAFLKELNLHPGVPPESIDLPPGERLPPELGQVLLDLRREGLNPNRGVRYFQDGNVLRLDRRSDQQYVADVKGSERYDLTLDIRESEFECSCPVPEYRGPCKHIYAAALTLAERERRRVLAAGRNRELSDDLIWLKQYLESKEDKPMHGSESGRERQEVRYYLFEARNQWHVLPAHEGPYKMDGAEFSIGVVESSPLPSTSGLASKDAVIVEHLNTNYYSRRPANREGILGEMLPMLSDRPVFVETADGSLTEAIIKDDRVTPGLTLNLSPGDNLRLEPFVTYDGERHGGDAFDLVCSNPMWVRVGPRFFRCTNYYPLFGDLLSRIDGEALEISGEEQSVFLEDLFPEMLDRELPVRMPEDRFEETEVAPEPHVYLSESGDRLRVKLTFAYGAVEFTRVSDGRFPIPDPDREKITQVERMPERERSWREELLETGLEPASDRREPEMIPEDRTRWLIEELPDLPDRGFEVFGEDEINDRPQVVEAENTRASLSGGIDWFALEGEVTFESGSVSFGELMDRAGDGQRYVKLAGNQYGRIPEKWIRRLANLDELAEADREEEIRVPGLTFGELNDLLEEVDEANTGETVERYRRFYREFDGIEPVRESDRFQGTLRDYQRAGLAWMQFLREYGFGGLLADDMGLGKTIQVLAHLQLVREKLGVMPDTLVVAPRSVLRNWEKEARRFLPDPPMHRHHGWDRRDEEDDWPEHHLTITTYGTMRSDIGWLQDVDFDTVVLDECQAIRNPDTKRAKASRLLSASYRLGLSGTPVQNTVMDLWSQFQFLTPGLLGSRSYFDDRFAGPIETERDQQRSDRLKRLIHPFLLRRTKEQVEQDLPALSRSVVDCPMPDEQGALYESCRSHYRDEVRTSMEENGVHQSRFKVLEGLTRLRQICCHPSLLNGEEGNGNTLEILREKTIPDVSSKLDRFLELAGEVTEDGHRALVFSQFVSFLDVIRDAVEREGWTYEYLDGSTRNREERVKRFQSDDSIPLFLISLKAGGEGLNLTGADYVFLMDPWWNPAVEQQAMDRTHRIGQDQPVMVYRLICPETIEEKMLTLQERKQDVAEDIVTPDADFFKDMDRDDLLDLFA